MVVNADIKYRTFGKKRDLTISWLLGNFEGMLLVLLTKQSLREKVQRHKRNSSDHLVRFPTCS